MREWAVNIDVPILSIEYSLTPRSPFPRAIEEVFYVYCWILKSAKLLGSTGEKILLVGDSAGANLNAAVVIKCIEMGIPVPHSMLSIYGLFISNYAAIPSRMMGFFDIFLFQSHIDHIVKTYAGHYKKKDFIEGQIPKLCEDEFKDLIPMNHLMSPLCASKEILREFPPTVLLTTNLDLCLDENVEMAKKLRAAGVNVKLDVIHDLIHGYMHVLRVSLKFKK